MVAEVWNRTMNGDLEIIAETIRNCQNYKTLFTRKLKYFYEQIIYYECLNYE